MRPQIICHMISSIDGRLLVDRWINPATGIDDDNVMECYDSVAARFEADGWIVGRKTMEDYATASARTVRPTGNNRRETYVADRKGRHIAVAIDPHGRVHYGQDNAGGDHVVAVLSENVSDEYLTELREDGVSYLFAGPDGRDLSRALDILGATFGIKTLLLQGGGVINGAFLAAGLIDEISLLIYPGIDGLAGVPSIFEYPGRPEEKPAAGHYLRHLHTETLDRGMVWVHYRVEKNP